MSVSRVASTIVPHEFKSDNETVSELLLKLSPDLIGKLRLNAPLVCTPAGGIVPVEFVLTGRDSILAIREHVWAKLLSLPDTERGAVIQKLKASKDDWLEWLFPPTGDPGFWDTEERIYRTRYMKSSALSKPRISRELAERRKLHDVQSYWHAVESGHLLPFIDDTLDFSPPDLKKPMAFKLANQPPEHGGHFEVRLSVGYRGCSRIFDYPFRASAFRRFSNARDVQPFDRLKRFVGNLIVELIWCTKGMTITPHESESIIQHYKILPWSYMTDVTYDIDIAKAFAASTCRGVPDHTPVLYKVALFNVDYYELGGSMIENLPFVRPKVQKAVSLVGMDQFMQDPTGVIVSLTEHPYYHTHTGTSWDDFGGAGFTLGGEPFDSPFLNDEEYRKVGEWLYPNEPEDIAAMLTTITAKMKLHIDSFNLSESDKEIVVRRIEDLDGELGA